MSRLCCMLLSGVVFFKFGLQLQRTLFKALDASECSIPVRLQPIREGFGGLRPTFENAALVVKAIDCTLHALQRGIERSIVFLRRATGITIAIGSGLVVVRD